MLYSPLLRLPPIQENPSDTIAYNPLLSQAQKSRYAAFKQRPTGDVMREWDALDITELIYDMYERYHVERIENAFEDIDVMVRERRNA